LKAITFRTENAAKQHFLKKCTTSALPLNKNNQKVVEEQEV